MSKVVLLASKSPRRRDILDSLAVDYMVVENSIDEVRAPDESAYDYVKRLAEEKARQHALSGPCLGADTIGVINGEILEKPKDKADAFRMWQLLSGKTHKILSAVAIAEGDSVFSTVVETSVSFRQISEAEMTAYWASGEPQDKAGGYAIQGIGAMFVTRIEGSYHAVVGLPVTETVDLLRRFNVPVLGLK